MPLQKSRLKDALIKKLVQLKSSTLPSMITTNSSLFSASSTPPSTINYSINLAAAAADDDGDFCCCYQYNDDYCCCKDDDDFSVPADVQKGFFAVYVGGGGDEEESRMRRYVIPVSYLRHRVIVALLTRAEEEFGFSHNNKGGIRLPCETVLFDHLLWLLNRDDPSIHSLEVDELLNFYK